MGRVVQQALAHRAPWLQASRSTPSRALRAEPATGCIRETIIRNQMSRKPSPARRGRGPCRGNLKICGSNFLLFVRLRKAKEEEIAQRKEMQDLTEATCVSARNSHASATAGAVASALDWRQDFSPLLTALLPKCTEPN